MLTIKTRKEAAQAGEAKYYTGKPCVNDHDGYRYTSSGICCACNVANARKYNKQMNREVNEKKLGYFSYPLHPDDYAAALSYCQALDMQRGKTPRVPPPPNAPVELPEWLIAVRQKENIDKYGPKMTEPYLPKP